MDLPKENINQELSWSSERAAAAVVVSTLPVFVYVEPRKTSSETWIHLCGTHISMLSYLFIDPCDGPAATVGLKCRKPRTTTRTGSKADD